ncbi:MAG: DUF3592 domain-containing protein [Oscillospiraceae bacterium]|nr:DUF3592 domain-containing protein [Oscillospiraceae bacterium]
MPRYKPDKTTLILGLVFFIIGFAAAAGFAVYHISYRNFERNADRINAVITNVDAYTTGSGKSRRTRHNVEVTYVYDGEAYTNSLDYYISGMRTGDFVEVLVNRDDPQNMRSEPKLWLLLFAGFFLIFGGVGFGLTWSEIGTMIKAKRLIDRDRYVMCDNWEEKLSGTAVNNVQYHRIIARYDNGIEEFTFKSRPFHPAKQPYVPGESVIVYVDIEENPKKYFVYLKD